MTATTQISRRVLLGSSAALALSTLLPRSALAAEGYWSPLRAPSHLKDRIVHSGHSLTDSYLHPGPWPGTMRLLTEDIGVRSPDRRHIKSTIPGSPIIWRWDNPTDPGTDARRDIANFKTLVITEGGPPARVQAQQQNDYMVQSLDYLCRFTANALKNGDEGRGCRDILLWSIWPSLTLWRPQGNKEWQEFPDFRAALPEYGRSFEFMAAYAAWKMRSFFTDLPDDWRIRVIPGHKWMERVWDAVPAGEMPGIRRIEELFVDDIHANDIGGYGLACLVVSCLYQRNLSERRRLFRVDGVSPELRDWCTRTAWEILKDYAPAGMGGLTSAGLLWDPEKMPDPLPDWRPPTD